MRAINAVGTSAYSNEATGAALAATQSAPAMPTGLVARDASTAQLRIGLSWTDTSSNELGFELERSTNGGPFILLQAPSASSTSAADSSLAEISGTLTVSEASTARAHPPTQMSLRSCSSDRAV